MFNSKQLQTLTGEALSRSGLRDSGSRTLLIRIEVITLATYGPTPAMALTSPISVLRLSVLKTSSSDVIHFATI